MVHSRRLVEIKVQYWQPKANGTLWEKGINTTWNDFEKPLHVSAPLRVLICKAEDRAHAEELLKMLRTDANDPAKCRQASRQKH